MSKEELLDVVTGLGSRIDYVEDELTTLREAIARLDDEIKSLKNPFSKQTRR